MTTSLTPEQHAEIRTGLLAELDQILTQVHTLAASDAELAAARISQEERAKSQGDADLLGVERDLVARMSESMQTSVAALTAALGRLEDGTYGVCSDCLSSIPAERLLARPRATTCVRCASRR